MGTRISLVDLMVVEQKQEELSQRAEYYRLVGEAKASRPQEPVFPDRIGLWLGHKLISLGNGLVAALECPEQRKIEFS